MATKVLFLFFAFFVSCSSEHKDPMIYGDKEFLEAFLSEPTAKWFKVDEKYTHKDLEGETVPHLFFDIKPILEPDELKIQFVVTTPAKSEYGMDLDLVSGRHVLSRRYCVTHDVWRRSELATNLPPFSLGFVPQTLDQLQMPQKVIIFGQPDYYQKHYLKHYFDGKVIGGFIEQVCYLRECSKPDQWKHHLVLVVVPSEDPKYSQIDSIEKLKKKEDWEPIVNFMQNGQGVNFRGHETTPAYKVGRILETGPEAFKYFKENRMSFPRKRQKQMQRTCFKLYDYIWKYLGKRNIFERGELNAEQIKKIAEYIREKNKLKKKYAPEYFQTRFHKTLKTYGKEFLTCTQYVKTSNLNYNSERFWFFSYMEAFTKLYDLGYFYNCAQRTWDKDSLLKTMDLNSVWDDHLKDCKIRELEFGLEMALNLFPNLVKDHQASYRFVDYDNSIHGSHNKIYGWVYSDGRDLSCYKKSQRDFRAELPQQFPREIRWQSRSVNQAKLRETLNDVIF